MMNISIWSKSFLAFLKKKNSLIKHVLKVLLSIVAVILIVFLAFVVVLQEKYLALGVANQSIESIDLVTYSGEPFRSLINEEKTISDVKVLLELQRQLNAQNMVLKKQQNESTILILTYSNGKKIVAYVNNDMLGLNYGDVWINVDDLESILQ